MVRCDDRLNGTAIAVPAELFVIRLSNARTYPASSFTMLSSPREASLSSGDGRALEAVMVHAASGLRVTWRAVLKDGAHYIRQEMTFEATHSAVAIDGVEAIALQGFGDALVAGQHVCACGMVLGRDRNAARIMLLWALAHAGREPSRVPRQVGAS
ncbi:MAG: hypothetical protein ACREMP_10855 [Candidatus Tyrphobacter sp.]